MTGSTILELSGISKRFDTQEILTDFNLSVGDGEFFTLLGPSGCGKTTLLRLIAGFDRPDAGQVLLNGVDITALPAERRPVNTVFQSYALFPHMTVYENVSFGLRMAGMDRAEIRERVGEALEIVRLGDLSARRPHQLSGGQKQRVAIARAVVNRPKLLLLDESLSALDLKLRQQMRIELKQLQRRLGITFIYVTHDQEEALSLSDRLLVLNNGNPQQIGTPREVYESPRNLFVARFIGEINVLDARIDEDLGDLNYRAAIQGVSKQIHADVRFEVGDRVHVLLRPEDLRIEYIEDAPSDRNGFIGRVLERNYTGQTLDSLIALDNGLQLTAHEYFNEDDPDFDYTIGQRVWVDWVPGWEHVIPAET
ncbi:MAG: spermidine/putrescine ABC transporter ATP-binding protein PotA [Candidatus Thiodiazotropha sp.]